MLLIAVVGGALGWRWWTDRAQRIELGDRGEVTAEVDPDCMSMTIRVGDEVYRAVSGVPSTWRGREVVGRLHLDENEAPQPLGGDDDETSARATGRFTVDGRTVEVSGGRNVFFHSACGIWPDD